MICIGTGQDAVGSVNCGSNARKSSGARITVHNIIFVDDKDPLRHGFQLA